LPNLPEPQAPQRFGDGQGLVVDLKELRQAIASGEVKGVRIHEHEEVLRANQLPINVELLAEDMGLEIWTVEKLIELAAIEALVIHKLNVVMVDENEFADSARWGRLRFTLAHEIGHYVLHSKVFESAEFKSVQEWIAFSRSGSPKTMHPTRKV